MRWGPILVAAGVGGALLLLSRRASAWGGRVIIVPNSMRFAPRTKPVRGIVIHHTHTATPAATRRVLEQRELSTNFEVDQAGNVYQYGDPAKLYAIATGAGANAHTIGIDVTHVGLSAPFPPAQIAALRGLVHQLANRFGFKVRVAPDGTRQNWAQWAPTGFTVFRHRNFVATACPANLPLEQVA